jgi:hypothetical protein
VHARGLAGNLSGTAQGATDCRGEFFASLWFGFSFHGDLSNTLVYCLSYQAHSSCLLKDDSASQNYSDCARSAGAHHAAEHYARLV